MIPRILPRRHPATGEAVEAEPRHRFKTPDRDSQYLAFVREHPCCHCGAAAPSDPHHVGREGMGEKVHDYRCVPLCRTCHNDVERIGHLPFWEADTRKELDLVIARLVLGYLGVNVTVRPSE